LLNHKEHVRRIQLLKFKSKKLSSAPEIFWAGRPTDFFTTPAPMLPTWDSLLHGDKIQTSISYGKSSKATTAEEIFSSPPPKKHRNILPNLGKSENYIPQKLSFIQPTSPSNTHTKLIMCSTCGCHSDSSVLPS